MSIPLLKYAKYEKLLHMHNYIYDYIGIYYGNVFLIFIRKILYFYSFFFKSSKQFVRLH